MFQNENHFPKRQRTSEPMQNRRTQYKTELCLKFQRGTCNYGDRCCFAHGYEDLIGFSIRQEQIALDEASRVKHLDTSRLCWRFMNGDKCQFGDKCHFHHLKAERKSSVINVLNMAGSGEMQQQKHTPWRTKLCNRWMSTGSCPYGLNCCFAHGESELQQHRSNAPCELINKSFEKKIDGKGWEFKWRDVEKIGRVYADWINESLVHL